KWVGNTLLQLSDTWQQLHHVVEAEQSMRSAVAAYQQLADNDPRNVDYRLHLARSYDDLARALVRQGNVSDSATNWDVAAAEYLKIIELKPDTWEAWSGRAFVYFHQSRWHAAAADFSKAIELAPQVHTNWWHRGHCYLNLQQWDNAAVEFKKIVDSWPD